MLSISEASKALEAVDLVQGLTHVEVLIRLKQGMQLRNAGQRILAFYLVEMDQRRLYQSTSHRSTVFFAESHLGLDRRRTGELLHVGRTLIKLPAIDQAFCESRLTWSKLLLLIRVVVPAHERAWLKRALELTLKDLALQIRVAKEGEAPRKAGASSGTPAVRYPHACKLAPVAHQKVELAKQKLGAELGHPVSEAEYLEAMADLFLNLQEDGSAPGHRRVDASLFRVILRPAYGGVGELTLDTAEGPLPLAADHETDIASVLREAEVVLLADDEGPDARKDGTHPTTPASLRAKIIARDGACCRACGATHELRVHHIRYRAKGGPTKAFNLITVCLTCHSLVHADLLVLVGERAEDVGFQTPAGEPLHVAEGGGLAGDLPALTAPVVKATPAAAAPTLTTLDTLPATIDGSWWQHNAHLLRYRKGLGLELRAGEPIEAPPPDESPAIDADPDAFAGIVGQDALLARLTIAANGSRHFGACFPHTCFVGPAGTGKTTLARRLGRACGARLLSTSGPLLEDAHTLISLLATLREFDMVFLDEIHAVPRAVLETLYEALAERRLLLTVRCGSRVRTVELQLPAFTLLAATTEEGDLCDALRSRFGLMESLGHYDVPSLAALALAKAQARGFTLAPPAASILAEHARGTPRELLRLLDRVLEFAVQRNSASTRLSTSRVLSALARLGYDTDGLNPGEQRYLALLRESPAPIPLRRLARMLGTSPRTLVEHVEPYLFQRGFTKMTPRGREAARAA